uniref:Letm1 RBD domain-containing protein n=1 Tax=Dendroctonus ponderosae TaxID=77166 RepID=J3JVS7_DENPD|nr:unknown [Dendroctonus ponderosae]
MALSLVVRTCRFSFCRFAPSKALTSYRSYGNNTPARDAHRKSVYKTEEAKRIRFYILNRFIEYLKNYDKILEKNFPTTIKTYRTFTDGIKTFSLETIEYFKIVMMLNSSGGSYAKLLRREIELYHQMPKDMMKVAPVIIFSALPFAFYVLLPLVYTLPKQLLTAHFWTPDQQNKFQIEYFRDRLVHNKPVFRHLQSQLNYIKHYGKNKTQFEKWANILGLLGSGIQPTADDILACKDLFMDEPYHLLYLSRNHVFHLLRVHNLHAGWFRRTRLADRAQVLIEMDKAILREGGVHNLPLNALSKACYIRGLNPTDISSDYQVKWLTQWIKVSSQVDKDNLSLLLHCPILLGYNEPSNWVLVYPKK